MDFTLDQDASIPISDIKGKGKKGSKNSSMTELSNNVNMNNNHSNNTLLENGSNLENFSHHIQNDSALQSHSPNHISHGTHEKEVIRLITQALIDLGYRYVFELFKR